MASTEHMGAAFRRASELWPDIALTLDQFCVRAATLAVSPQALEARCQDLFLAFACAEREPHALHALEERYLSQIDSHVRRFALPNHLMDEVRQRLRVKLLVGASPGIARYAGHGPLLAFVRVAAVRVAVDTVTAAGAELGASEDDLLESYASFADDPEIGTIKNLYRDRFRAQLEESFAALSLSDKTLLRLHLVDRLDIDAIGAIYRSHRATVARRLVGIRAKLLADLRQRFALRWGVSSSEVRSLFRLLGNEIHLSARRVLNADP